MDTGEIEPQMDTDGHRWEKGRDMVEDELNGITERIIGCAYKVSTVLGIGFLEKVYENSLAHELRKAGLKVEQQKRFRIFYDGVEVGYYDADLVVEEKIIVETKTVRAFDDIHMAQCLNYLKATGLTLGLLLNFATPKLGIKRIAR
jgi:GxxExxY protein